MILNSKKNARRDQTSFGAIDYVLMSAGCCLAAYSAGMAVGAPECGEVFVAFIALGTVVSLTVRKFFSTSRFLQLDALFYTLASIGAVIFTVPLNGLLPADGIPPDVTTAGWLCWMLSFGSFLAWRDRTLLFQAVPTIALFGLIGCYDTFPPAPFLFFGFLLCLATLLGRSHSREMLRLAVLSGYFNRGESKVEVSAQPEQSPELYEAIKRGPWRWLAGPEWALLSGLVIVIFSLLGAPVIRLAVQPISGAVRVLAPRRMRQSPASRPNDSSSGYTVGRGPLSLQKMPPVPQYSVKFDRIRYLRTAIYDNYNGHTWLSSLLPGQDPEQAGIGAVVVDKMTNRRPIHISVEILSPTNVIPLPAEVTGGDPTFQLKADGSGIAHSEFAHEFEVFGFDSATRPTKADRTVPGDLTLSDLDRSPILPAVSDFAEQAAQGGASDFDKATAVMNAISSRCNYYKSPSPVPEGRDAVDYFLNTSQQGYCDLFASAMVECARAIGIPSHFCIGYLADAKNTDSKGLTIVYDKDYHAWAELYFKDVGWVVFDATAGAKEIDPDAPPAAQTWFSDALPTILDGFIGIIAVGVIGAAAYSLLRGKKKTAAVFHTETKKVYAKFSKILWKYTGERRDLTETADEYLTRIAPYLGQTHEAAVTLNRKLVDALYGPTNLEAVGIAALWTELKQMETRLKRQPRQINPEPPA